MYPDFYYLLQSLLGIDVPVLSILKTFGFFVALAFIVSAWVLGKELKRKAQLGYFKYTTKTETVGMPPQTKDYVSSTIIGFILGFKLVGLFQSYEIASGDPIAYLVSLKGSLVGGLVFAALMGFLRYREAKKAQLPKPKKVSYKIFPHDRIMDIVFISAAAGFIGAKVFNALESWDSFVRNPIDSLISSGGFTFYGGLICAFAALLYYARKHRFSFAQLCDAAAPALMIAYAIGRLGCHFSGDGDWGVYNSAYISNIDGTLTEQVDDQAFKELVAAKPALFTEFQKYKEVPNIHFTKPAILPRWMVAMNYQHNVNKEGFPVAGDTGEYNTVLPAAVFPTPVYEFIVCSLLFVVLMVMRKRFTVPLKLFGLYLIFNGLERFFVEKIRVNYKYEGFFNLTQAEIISAVLVLIGLYLLLRNGKPAEILTTEPYSVGEKKNEISS